MDNRPAQRGVVLGVAMAFNGMAACALVLLAFLAAPGAAAAADVKFYPLETFTITYAHEGVQVGTSTLHVRDFGGKRAEVRFFASSAPGYPSVTRERVVTQGAIVTTVDLATKTGVRIENPMYARMVQAIPPEGTEGLAPGTGYIRSLGGIETGEVKTVAGETCAVWTVVPLGQAQCLSVDGLPLEIITGAVGFTSSQTAVEVRRNDPGPDDAFAVDGVAMTDYTVPPR